MAGEGIPVVETWHPAVQRSEVLPAVAAPLLLTAPDALARPQVQLAVWDLAAPDGCGRQLWTWEIVLYEREKQFSAGALPLPPGATLASIPGPLLERPSGVLSLLVRPQGGASEQWWHAGRGMLAVTSQGVTVELWGPLGARELASGVPASAAVLSGIWEAIVPALSVRGVPSRSRRPSWWRNVQRVPMGRAGLPSAAALVDLYPGCVDVWVDSPAGILAGNSVDLTVALADWPIPLWRTGAVAPAQNVVVPRWTPTEGARAVQLVNGDEENGTVVRVVQRGRI